jgi:hypothetical protein
MPQFLLQAMTQFEGQLLARGAALDRVSVRALPEGA